MTRTSWTKDLVVLLVVAAGVVVLPEACLCHKTPETAQDAGGTTSSTTHEPAVEAGPEAPQEPVLEWVHVKDLHSVEGLWGSKDAEEGWAELTSRQTAEGKGERWRYPYPWHLLLAPPGGYVLDCGIYPEPQDDGGSLIGWRVGWCEGGELSEGRRHARKVFFHRADAAAELLGIEILGLVKADFDRH